MQIRERILSEIFDDPTKRYYIRELARKVKANPNSIINAAKELEKRGLIKREAKKHIVEIIPNLDSPKFAAQKKIYNLTRIYDSSLVEFLVKRYAPKSIILFGSYSRGEDIKGSDIDIAVITDNAHLADIIMFEKRLNRKIHLSLMQYQNISEEMYNSLINGIILYGYLDAIK